MSDDIGKICLGWWGRLIDVNTGGMRADLARLRRANGVTEALAVRAVHDLNSRLRVAGHDLQFQPDRLTLIALVLAQVKENTTESAAQQMGQGAQPALSEIRFSTLIRTTTLQELVVPMRRSLRSIGQRANVARLSTDLYWWNDTTRARWCFDYYGASDAALKVTQQETEA